MTALELLRNAAALARKSGDEPAAKMLDQQAEIEERIAAERDTHDRVGISVTCTVCGKRKKPRGRSGPMMMAFCEPDRFGDPDGCDGYDKPPLVGDLWPGETCADFGFTHCHEGTKRIEQEPTP